MDKYKVKFHFIDSGNGFLDGFYKIVEARSAYGAFMEFSNNDFYATKWRGKWVCINIKNVSFMECEEVDKGVSENDR